MDATKIIINLRRQQGRKNKSYPYIILENDLVINMGALKHILKNISVNKDTLFFYLSVSDGKEIYGLTKAFRCR